MPLAALLLLRGLGPALDNGIVQPPMGFSTWNHFGGANCTRFVCEAVNLTEIADAMVSNGLRDAGYVYVNLDDGWVSGRSPNGSIIPDPKVFPQGVKAVADYLHSIGMKLGLYTSRGQTTCMRRTGSQDYESVDMQQYADWEIDYVKVDSCGGDSAMSHDSVWEQYALYRDALNASGRQIYLQTCNTLHYDDPFPEMRQGGGFAATMRPWAAQGRDVRELANGVFIQYTNNLPSWTVMLSMIDSAQLLTYDNVTGPGSFSDMDMMEICNHEAAGPAKPDGSSYGITYDEMRAQISIWSILTSPLIMGNDPRHLTSECVDILTNREIIEINQDPLVTRGTLVYQGTPGQPAAAPVEMGGGLIWWPNASWVPTVPPIGAGTLSSFERIPKTYNVTDCIGCGSPPESLCWNDTKPHGSGFREGAHCNKPGANVSFSLQVWAKTLHNGDVAVVAFNRGDAPVLANISWGMIGLRESQKAVVRDLWANQEVPGGPLDSFVVGEVKPHAVWALRIVPSAGYSHVGYGTSRGISLAEHAAAMLLY